MKFSLKQLHRSSDEGALLHHASLDHCLSCTYATPADSVKADARNRHRFVFVEQLAPQQRGTGAQPGQLSCIVVKTSGSNIGESSGVQDAHPYAPSPYPRLAVDHRDRQVAWRLVLPVEPVSFDGPDG